jgi:hypothetical protein
MGQCVEHSIVNIGSSTCNEDLLSLSDKINNILYSISSDLQPLHADKSMFENECTGPDINFITGPNAVECKLRNIDVHKDGPEYVRNWVFRDFSVWVAEPS